MRLGRGPVRAALLLIPVIMMLWCRVAGAELIDRIVAIVNGDIITLSELRAVSLNYLQKMNAKFDLPYGKEQIVEAERRILDQLIDEKLVDQEGDRLAVVITDREVDSAVRDMQSRNKVTDAQFAALLAEEGMTLQVYREQLKKQMKKVRLIDQEIRSRVQVTSGEIEAYYEKHAGDFNIPPQVRLQQIRLIIPPQAAEEELARLRAQAESILARIRQGEDFTSLVGLYSQDPSAAVGGDMGIFRQGELLTALDEYAFSMKEGEVSPVIQTETSFHILKVLERREPTALSEEERKYEIKDVLYNQKVENDFKEWLKKLRKKSYLAVNL
jgi:peptidyl-prolyl cis-trans isomerase SurA